MTVEDQNIVADFYSGNHKTIQVTVRDGSGNLKDLTGAIMTFALFKDDPRNPTVILRKSTVAGGIVITSPATGEAVITFVPKDTRNIYGTYRYQINVLDDNDVEETVTTGFIKIFRGFAVRYNEDAIPAFMSGQ